MNLHDAPVCKAADCGTRTKSKVGYCAKHYFLSKTKNQGPAPSCRVCGETLRRDNASGLCAKHRSGVHAKNSPAPARRANGKTNGHADPEPQRPTIEQQLIQLPDALTTLKALREQKLKELDAIENVLFMLGDGIRVFRYSAAGAAETSAEKTH